jgi:hypothetical protein
MNNKLINGGSKEMPVTSGPSFKKISMTKQLKSWRLQMRL